ncbi:octaprenyl diphosphate synthase [Agarivorans sp. B2Z047]|uniref:octaprenyl diphosphate synthase n=1 Tax=Agarivorans sp. B2Z047 TaxID=2652721 RepID=UPI00128AFC91|nr:octaprenyl diphosphate synthase [Agarivorans sp. B2Z047]MPW31405.1 octaprenyl diphosphate synthase [Agarivorans sp. B2Z047]UQN42449.1 octaprenyl diphosphate synthase [Agarivorans sp. B2Z047]
MQLDAIKKLSDQDMSAVNELIFKELESDVALINQISFYIVNSGGKRIRPLLAVLAARALGYQQDQHIKLAAIIEFIHTSTLLHDDVVDESELRRGKDTANARFGNAASVLVGDFLYSRSFQLMTQLQNLKVMDILADATNVIAEGEVLQLINCNDPDTDEARYFEVIYCKTAKLFEAATRLAAVIGEQSAEIELAMQDYGKYLGTAFQIMDDVLDYVADQAEMGKNVGDDLAEGKPTLPLIYAMEQAEPADKALISEAIKQGGSRDQLDEILAILDKTKALDFCRERAAEEAQKAIDALALIADSDYKQALMSLANIAADRAA